MWVANSRAAREQRLGGADMISPEEAPSSHTMRAAVEAWISVGLRALRTHGRIEFVGLYCQAVNASIAE